MRSEIPLAPPDHSFRIRPAHLGRVNCVAAIDAGSDNTVLVSGGSDGRVRGWSVLDDARPGVDLHLGRKPIVALAWTTSGDGSPMLFAADSGGLIHTMDPRSGKHSKEMIFAGPPTREGFTDKIVGLTACTSRDGTVTLVGGARHGGIQRWNGLTGESLDQTPAWLRSGLVNMPDGAQPFARAFDQSLASQPTLTVFDLLVWREELLVVTGYDDGVVIAWHGDTGVVVRRFDEPHNGPIAAIATEGQSGALFATCGGTQIRRWHLEQGAAEAESRIATPVCAMVMTSTTSTSSPVLTTGHTSGEIRQWTGEQLVDLPLPVQHLRTVTGMAAAVLADGRRAILSGSMDGRVLFWESSFGDELMRARCGHRGVATAMATTDFEDTDGSEPQIISGGDDGIIRVWRAIDGTPLGKSILAHEGGIASLTVSQGTGGLTLVSVGSDSSVKQWQLPFPSSGSALPLYDSTQVDTAGFRPRGPVFKIAAVPVPGPSRINRPSGQLVVTFGNSNRLTVRESELSQPGGQDVSLTRSWDPTSAPWGIGNIQDIATIPGNQRNPALAVLTDSHDVYRYDITHEGTTAPVPLESSGISSLSKVLMTTTDGDGTPMIIVYAYERALSWNAFTGVRLFASHLKDTGPTSALAASVSDDGRMLLHLGGIDGYIRRYWADTGDTDLTALPTHLGAITQLQVIRWPQANSYEQRVTVVISAGVDGTIVARPITSRGEITVAPDPQVVPSTPDDCFLDWTSEPVFAADFRSVLPVLVDDEAADDLLGRDVLAAHLDGALAELAHGSSSRTAVVHVDGAWGSGKSTLLSIMLRRAARTDSPGPGEWSSRVRRPVVVRYDAWRENSVGPAWWSLGAALNRTLRSQRSRAAGTAMTIVSVATRLRHAPAWSFAATAVTIVATLLIAAVLRGRSAAASQQLTATFTAIGSLGVLAALTLTFGRVLFWSSPTFGRLHQSDDNGFDSVAAEIARLRRWSPRDSAALGRYESALGLILFLQLSWIIPGLLKPDPPSWRVALAMDSLMSLALGLVSLAALTMALFTADSNPDSSQVPRDQPSHPPGRFLAMRRRHLRPIAWIICVSFAVAAVTIAALRPGRLQVVDLAWLVILVGLSVSYVRQLLACQSLPRRPLVLVIDDLDRCSSERVVSVLESVHTLLREPITTRAATRLRSPGDLLVLVLADGRWLRRSFETAYHDFVTDTDLPLRGVGSNFLHKIFDHTVLVPPVSSRQQSSFVRNVTGAGWDPVRQTPPTAPQTETSVDQTPAGSLVETPTGHDAVSPVTLQNWQDEAMRAAIAAHTKPADARVTHLLATYGDVLPTNPRLFKRTAGALGMLFALQGHTGHHEDPDTVVRAAIVMIAFPDLLDRILHDATPPTLEDMSASVRDVLGSVDVAALARCYGREYGPGDTPTV